MRKILVVAFAFCFLNGVVSAQEYDAPAIILTDANASIAVLGLTVEQTVGKEVFDADGVVLGTVTRVIGDDQDTPTGLVLSTGRGTTIVELADTELINNRIVLSTPAD